MKDRPIRTEIFVVSRVLPSRNGGLGRVRSGSAAANMATFLIRRLEQFSKLSVDDKDVLRVAAAERVRTREHRGRISFTRATSHAA